MPLRQLCQHQNRLGQWPLTEQVRRTVQALPGFRTLFHSLRSHTRAPGLGNPSAFVVGQMVRVKDRAAIENTLDEKGRLRGLQWMEPQWSYCGTIQRVSKQVRRIMEKSGVIRSPAGTVILENVTCAGISGTVGCGRACALFFRDDWLEATNEEARDIPYQANTRHATVRSVADIRATLDAGGGRDGLMFMPEMAQFADRRFPILKTIDSVQEACSTRLPRAHWYVLRGLQCSGAVLGRRGPCHSSCGLIWHPDWLRLVDRRLVARETDPSITPSTA